MAILEVGECQYLLQENNNYLIGRKPENENTKIDIPIDCEVVDCHHALLQVKDGCVYLIDLNSTKGTLINNSLVSGMSTIHIKKPTDLTFGCIVATLQFFDDLKFNNNSGLHVNGKNRLEIKCDHKKAKSNVEVPHRDTTFLLPGDKNRVTEDINNRMSVQGTQQVSMKIIDEKSAVDIDSFMNTTFNSIANNSDEFCIPETQDIVTNNVNLLNLDPLPSELYSSQSTSEAGGTQIRIATQDFNDIDNSQDSTSSLICKCDIAESSKENSKIALNEVNPTMLTLSVNNRDNSTDKEICSILRDREHNAAATNMLEKCEENLRLDSCTPDLFDFPEFEKHTIASTGIKREEAATPKQEDSLLQDKDELDLMPTQLFLNTKRKNSIVSSRLILEDSIDLEPTQSFHAPNMHEQTKNLNDTLDLMPTQPFFMHKTNQNANKSDTARKINDHNQSILSAVQQRYTGSAVEDERMLSCTPDLFDHIEPVHTATINKGELKQAQKNITISAVVHSATNDKMSKTKNTTMANIKSSSSDSNSNILVTLAHSADATTTITIGDQEGDIEAPKLLCLNARDNTGSNTETIADSGCPDDLIENQMERKCEDAKLDTISNPGSEDSFFLTPQIVTALDANIFKQKECVEVKRNLFKQPKHITGDSDNDEMEDGLAILSKTDKTGTFEKLFPHLPKPQEISTQHELEKHANNKISFGIETPLIHKNKSNPSKPVAYKISNEQVKKLSMKVKKPIVKSSTHLKAVTVNIEVEPESKPEAKAKVAKRKNSVTKPKEMPKRSTTQNVVTKNVQSTEREERLKVKAEHSPPMRKTRSQTVLTTVQHLDVASKTSDTKKIKGNKTAKDSNKEGANTSEKNAARTKKRKLSVDVETKSTIIDKKKVRRANGEMNIPMLFTSPKEKNEDIKKQKKQNSAEEISTRTKMKTRGMNPANTESSTTALVKKNSTRTSIQIVNERQRYKAMVSNDSSSSTLIRSDTKSSKKNDVSNRDKKMDSIDSGNSTINQSLNETPKQISLRSRKITPKSAETIKTPSLSSTKKKLKKKIKVCLSLVSFNISALVKNFEDLLIVVSDPTECDVLVMGEGTRTYKFLVALARGRPILNTDWLQKIFKEQRLLPIKAEYCFKDPGFEKNFKFKLYTSLKLANEIKILQDLEFVATPSVIPKPNELEVIIKCAGGIFHEQMPKTKEQQIYLISCNEDRDMWPIYRCTNENLQIIHSEGILLAVMHQKTLPITQKTYILY